MASGGSGQVGATYMLEGLVGSRGCPAVGLPRGGEVVSPVEAEVLLDRHEARLHQGEPKPPASAGRVCQVWVQPFH